MDELHDLEHVQWALDHYYSVAGSAETFRALVTSMHLRAGMAKVHGWQAVADEGGCIRWEGDEPSVKVTQFAIGNGD